MLGVPLAYIDPGSGSLLIQVVIAAIIAIPVLLRDRVSRIVQFVRRRSDAPVAGDRSDRT